MLFWAGLEESSAASMTVGGLYFDFEDAQQCAFNIGGKAGRVYTYKTRRITERLFNQI